MQLRILVAVADRSTRESISELLVQKGHGVTGSESRDEALAALEGDPFPIVIIDVDEEMDLVRRAKSANTDATVIAVTDGRSPEKITEVLQLGAFDHLVRPLANMDLVAAALNRAIQKAELQRDNRHLLESLKRNVEEMGKLNSTLRELATRDGLTGLFNHRFFREALDQEISRCTRHERTFSLIFLDVDYFKKYNDTHGHLAGDEVLVTLATEIKQASRATTILARYGGEEFVLLVPETDGTGARIYAEKVRKLVEEHPFKGRETQPDGAVTLSLGVATFPHDGRDSASLINYADQALYRAKEGGRNRVCW